jgi:hypothetical protein
MAFQTTLASLLVLHVIGLVMMAGGVLADFSLRTRFNKYLLTDRVRALTLLEGSAALLPLIGGGALLLILSGTAMVIQLKSAVTQMVWFRVKMPLVILLVLNGAVPARRLGLQLFRLLSAGMEAGGSSSRSAGTGGIAGSGRIAGTGAGGSAGTGGSTSREGNTSRIVAVQSRLRLVYVVQLILFLSIFILSIFKF